MKPLFTIHAGEYLVGEYIERTYPRWNVWLPSKDTGVDFLLSDERNRKTVSVQVKFSKDFNPGYGTALKQSKMLACGWWTHDLKKLQKSSADFWVFVLPSFFEKQTCFIVIRPAELFRRLNLIHGKEATKVHSYIDVTKSKKCWETRGLSKSDRERVALDEYADAHRNFSKFLNSWEPIEKILGN